MSSELELSSFTPSTPLLYDRILEDTEVRPENTPGKVSVIIENPAEDEAPNSSTSAVITKWKLRNGLLHCSDGDIEDEWGHAAYHVDTSGFFFIDLKLIDQATGRTSAILKQRWGFMPKFDIYLGDGETKYATIQMNCSWIGVKAVVTFADGSPDLTLKSNAFGTSSSIYRGDVVVASNNRSWRLHEYEIAAGENQVLHHALFVAFDKILILTRRKAFNL